MSDIRHRRHHRRLRRDVEAYIDGFVMSPDRASAVRAHLAECWDCSGDADTLRLIKVALRRLGDAQPSSLTSARIRRWAGTALR